MKQLGLFIVAAALAVACFAGIDEFYSFNATVGTYTPITGTSITSIQGDDMLSEAIDIGFNFPYGEGSYTQVKVSSNGWVGLGTGLTHSNLSNNLNTDNWFPVAAALWDDTSLGAGSAEYLTSGTAPNRIFTVQYTNLRWNYSGDNQFNLQIRLYESGKLDFVYGSATGVPNWPSASIGINMSPGGTGWFYSVTPGTPTTASTTVENNSISVFPSAGEIYEFLPSVPAANDLAAIGLTGNLTPSVDTPTIYTVTVRNRGSNPQSNYQVKLVTSAGAELASVAGTALTPGQVVDFPITWTPQAQGPLTLRGKVVLAGDENPNNDQSQLLSITVMPAGMVVMTIGAGDQSARMPVDMWWRNSLFETLYYPAEIGMVGNITALSFYNDFQSNLPNLPTKVWLGTTQSADLSAGWIPSTQLTLVFDGTVTYPSGQNTVIIPLQTVYTYTGGNLVLMVNRPMDTQYYNSSDNFFCQTLGAVRTRNIYSDSTLFDPAAPPPTATLSGQFPKTSIHLTPLGTDPMTIISPDAIDFGQVLMNTVHTRQITILNGGGGTLGINSISLAGDPSFTLQNVPNLPVNLVTGQNVQLNVVYAPTGAGTQTGTITVVDNLTRTPHTVTLTATSSDPTVYTLPYAQDFDAVTAPALPLDWSRVQQTTSTGAYVRSYSGTSFTPPNSVQFYNEGDETATLLLIAPPYAANIPTNSTRVHFRGYSGSTEGYPISVGIMTNSQDPATFTEVQTVNLTSTWTEFVVSFAAYAGTGRYVAFKHGLGGTWRSLYVDSVVLEVTPQDDLAATAVTGNTTPSVGNPTVYTASVYNWGTISQSNYTVKLFDSNNLELASVPGVTVLPAQTAQVAITWTPAAQGVTQIYAKTFLTGDQNPLNDASPSLALTVMPEGMMVVTVGAGDQQALIPVNMFYRNSLYETMFYPTELGLFGTVTALSFYNNFQTNLPNMPTRIWLGSTQSADLSAGWIPSTQLTQVFDGTVNYPSGINTITVALQNAFTYAGGNLVMLVQRPMDTTYYSSMDRFYCQSGGVNRTRYVWSDWDPFDPATPPTGGAYDLFPKTSFHLTPLGPDPVFLVNPTNRNFGTVLLNSTHDQTFTVMNAGGGSLTVNTIDLAGSDQFSLQNLPALPASLNTGQFITFTGRYHPIAAGTHTATITVNDNLRSAQASRDPGRTPHAIALSGVCVDPTINALPYLQTFDEVTAPALPVQWTKIESSPGTDLMTYADVNYSPPNSVLMANNGETAATLILIAPPYATTISTPATRTKFWARSGSTNASLGVGIITDPQDAGTYVETQTVALSTVWAEYVVSFSGYAGTGRTVAFRHGQGGSYQDIYIDNVMLEYTPQNDLAALSVQGNVTPSVGLASTYTVSIFNWGTSPQNSYTVKLFKAGEVELASVAGPPVNPNQTVQASLAWTPDAQGPTSLYGKIVLATDQNSLNDQSPYLPVTVQPEGLVVLTVGDGSATGRIPVDMYYRNSLFECLYYPAELGNTIGSIFGIGFYNSFVTDLPNLPTNIWIGTTAQTDLSAGWIPSTQLTQVFSGTVNYPSGQNMVYIPFTQPFLYLTADNLVVMVQRPMDTQYYSYQDVFLTQTGTSDRARNVYSDGTNFDPTSPPAADASAVFPKTSLFIVPGGVGHLTGTVYGVNNQPLEGVALQSAAGGYSAITDAAGHYMIHNIIAGTYQFTFSRYGYIDQAQTVVIPEDETVTLNINLQQMPVVTVSGTIVGSDTNAGLNGAGIYLEGYEDYSSSTNAAGLFNIPGVYANHSYAYTIICPGYQNASGNIDVGAGNFSFGTIVLNEVAYAPRQVHGQIIENNTQVRVSWSAPDPTALDVIESFEGDAFPPDAWSRVITNQGGPNSVGVYPSWCRFGAITVSGNPATPPDGGYQTGLWWSYEHQDEWLITPSFNCPPAAYLSFGSYVFLGSTNGDHYYVKVSTDDGNTWTPLWDASTQTGDWNYYASPITVDLAQYEGLQLKIAWHADDPPTNDGMWYVWFIDDIYIGNSINPIRFELGDLARRGVSGVPRAQAEASLPLRESKALIAASHPRRSALTYADQPGVPLPQRELTGYRVWRLQVGQEGSEASWNLLTAQPVTDTLLTDAAWASLPNGTYRWAVKAVYTSNVLSVASLSNPLAKEVISGYISGVVRTVQNVPIPGATVSAGTYSATTNTGGAYSIVIPIGVYAVTASKQGYLPQTVENVQVNANLTTTVNFNLTAGTGAEDDLLPVAATELTGNFPNPFNPSTAIVYALKDAGPVELYVYNSAGQLVRRLVDSVQASGYYTAVWDGRDIQGREVASGVYFYQMRSGSYSHSRKMLLLK